MNLLYTDIVGFEMMYSYTLQLSMQEYVYVYVRKPQIFLYTS